jgi:hypothetical protein
VPAKHVPEDGEDDDSDDGDRCVLAVEIGAGAFLHRGRNLLHARGPGIGSQDLPAGHPSVQQGQHAAGYDD